jgi:hypothetical protein
MAVARKLTVNVVPQSDAAFGPLAPTRPPRRGHLRPVEAAFFGHRDTIVQAEGIGHG